MNTRPQVDRQVRALRSDGADEVALLRASLRDKPSLTTIMSALTERIRCRIAQVVRDDAALGPQAKRRHSGDDL